MSDTKLRIVKVNPIVTRVVNRDDYSWLLRDGHIVPDVHGQLPPAGAEDAVEVRAAELAADDLEGGHGRAFTRSENEGWNSWVLGYGSATAPDADTAGWLAAQIVNGDNE